MKFKILKYSFLCTLLSGVIFCEKSKITIFVHGTLPPLINYLLYQIDIPKGLTSAKKLKDPFFQGQVPFILSKADPKDFPLEHFYVFGWPGTFSRKARAKAANELYHELKKLDGDITVIGHSHGGSVSLNLAKSAKEHKDNNFKIDRLILLGAPVQSATKKFITSEVFNKVISFYSPIDWLQICDPQGLYTEDEEAPFFSERRWPTKYNIPEVRVCFDSYDVWHLDFIRERFLRNLPTALSMVSDYQKSNEKCDVKFNIKRNKNKKRSRKSNHRKL